MSNSPDLSTAALSPSIRKGSSCEKDPFKAIQEFHEAVDQPHCALVVFFCSSEYDLSALALALRTRFGDLPLIGCTTAGEITPQGYQTGGISGFSLASPDFVAVTRILDGLSNFSITKGKETAEAALSELKKVCQRPIGDDTFAFLLIDGMSQREEVVVSALHSGLQDVPLFGGSAGSSPGEPTKIRTWVYCAGEFRNDRAVLSVISTLRPFVVFKTENFVPTDTKMVITEAQSVTRKVLEINGVPAAPEYLRLAGMPMDTSIMEVSAVHPVGVLLGDQLFLRAIGWAGDDSSITFVCAIDEGVILTMASEVDFIENLQEQFDAIKAQIGTPELTIACDCFSRLLDMDRKDIKKAAGTLMSANNAIGFNTYGEQFNSMHMNQTLTGVAIGKARR